MTEPLWILGGGGHAKVVIATARAAGFTSIEIADDDPGRAGSELLGARVETTIMEVIQRPELLCVLAVGDNRTRHRLAATARCRFATLQHPSAIVHESVNLGAGTVVFAGSVIQPDSRLGAHVIVNTGASIDHDCVLEDAVHVAPGVRLAGNVTLRIGSFLGISAAVIPGKTLGAWSRVGAGGVVINDLADGVTAVGVPARPH